MREDSCSGLENIVELDAVFSWSSQVRRFRNPDVELLYWQEAKELCACQGGELLSITESSDLTGMAAFTQVLEVQSFMLSSFHQDKQETWHFFEYFADITISQWCSSYKYC